MQRLVWSVVILLAVAAPVFAQGTLRMWYSGPFDATVEVKSGPAYGYYYRPATGALYPLNEAAYGQPIPCPHCGHSHWAGEAVCPYCGQQCGGGGNREPADTVYSARPLPGMYLYEKPATRHFAAPMRVGPPFLKYGNR